MIVLLYRINLLYPIMDSLRQERREQRIAKAHEISEFMNHHNLLFVQDDEKNGQGLVFLHALNLLQGSNQDPRRRTFTLREIAQKIDEERMWFDPQIKVMGGKYKGPEPDAECPPYQKSVNGRKQAVQYLDDDFTTHGNNRRTNYILNQLKSSVVTKKRSHDSIRKYIEETDDGCRIVLPPPVRRLIVVEGEITSEPDHNADIDAARRFATGPVKQGQQIPPSNTNRGRSSSQSPFARTHSSHGGYSRGTNFSSGGSPPGPPLRESHSHDSRVGKKEVRELCRQKWGPDWHLSNKDARKKEAGRIIRGQPRTQRSPSGACRKISCRCGRWFTPPPTYRGSSPECITCFRSNPRHR